MSRWSGTESNALHNSEIAMIGLKAIVKGF